MSREIPLVMPKMSMTMETGELLEWAKSVGDEVTCGDVVAVVQTDKVDMEVESPVDGKLIRIVADEGAVVDVGKPLAYISTEAEGLMEGLLDIFEPTPEQIPSADGDSTSAQSDPPAATTESSAERLVATPPSRKGPQPAVPFARRRAAELGVSLGDLTGTGPDGLITVMDVERRAKLPTKLASNGQRAPSPEPAAPAKPADSQSDRDASQPDAPQHQAAQPDAPQPQASRPDAPQPHAPVQAGPGFADALAPRRRSVRAAVARTMAQSALVPQFTVFAELDLENLQRARNGIGWTTLLVRALARALRSEPAVLAGWNSETDAPASAPEFCGVALATDTAVGLLAPVLRDPDLLSVAELDSALRSTIERARGGRLTLADMQGATTTLSNLGGYKVPSFTSLLTPPQASALSVGSISPRPAVVHGGLAVRLGVTVGLTVDHRAVDGADAARVLDALRGLCERPDTLLQ